MITNIRKTTNYRNRKKNIKVDLEEEAVVDDSFEPIDLNFDVLPHNPYTLDYLEISDLEDD
ncbi:hypothetical protein DID80_03655 [Candidatus Marinamargulisbacteria bacterium SCGC AAA071-K20]|nr:hypothetical protein DID80_03655 [Candidatus Marinamargulisbacteria bacterium SCGC AAA071-K20]